MLKNKLTTSRPNVVDAIVQDIVFRTGSLKMNANDLASLKDFLKNNLNNDHRKGALNENGELSADGKKISFAIASYLTRNLRDNGETQSLKIFLESNKSAIIDKISSATSAGRESRAASAPVLPTSNAAISTTTIEQTSISSSSNSTSPAVPAAVTITTAPSALPPREPVTILRNSLRRLTNGFSSSAPAAPLTQPTTSTSPQVSQQTADQRSDDANLLAKTIGITRS